ncbi:MAG: putative AlkP superfamily pyrophosphatase or phosphodiesterase [Kiritimatiellia bacterium]|jgi:predicted AlkP superfamily pyrophosphatase or phosphodiesterase
MRTISLFVAVAFGVSCVRTPPEADTAVPFDPGTDFSTEVLQPAGPALVLVSIDGMRHDYMQRVDTPNLDRIAAGVRAEGLRPPFPSYTFPSHYTMATGLYPEHHGIVSNVFWDPVRQEQFKIGDAKDMVDPLWWGGEPIWNTAERNGVRAATLFWPGSEALIGGAQASDWTAYNGSMSHKDRVDRVLGWLDRPGDTRPGFITLYFSSVDHAGHTEGPDSDEIATQLQDVDAAMGLLLDGLQSRGHTDVDVVVVSDHGMAARSATRVDIVDDKVDLTGIQVVEWSPLFSLNAPEERREGLMEELATLEHTTCYLKDETPEIWHYREHRAIADVVCVADVGWAISGQDYFDANRSRFGGGTHGYDSYENSEMLGVFLATGPRFKNGVVVPVFDNVHLYGVLAKAMDLQPAPNDGDPAMAAQFLK